MRRRRSTSEPSAPRLTWPGRGRPVVRDDETGRWRYGERAERSPRLRPPDETNLIIHAEAHDALTALQATHKGRIRLCYIDPPFNTGQDFAAYRDRAAHDVWLSGLEERLVLARELLLPGGFLCVHLNVVEQAYLKVLLDELFGRDRLVAQVAWQRSPDRTLLGQGSALVADQVEYLLIYVREAVQSGWPRPQRRTAMPARTLATYGRTLVPSARARLVETFTQNDAEVRLYRHDSYALARSRDPQADFDRLMRLTNQQEESTFQQTLLRRMPERDVLYRAEYTQRTGKHRGARARWYLNNNVVLWLRDVAALGPRGVERIADLNNFWTAEDIPATGIAREGGVTLRRGKKPERLLERVITAFSLPGEWVLDFFAGSGTTGAVAERLGRRWILVEAGDPALDLCVPRLTRATAVSGGEFALLGAPPRRQ